MTHLTSILQPEQIRDPFLVLLRAALQLLIVGLCHHGAPMDQHRLTLSQGCPGLLGERIQGVTGRVGSAHSKILRKP